jgi:hypothetical protein
MFQIEQQAQLADQVVAADPVLRVARLAQQVADARPELADHVALLVQQGHVLTDRGALPQQGGHRLRHANSTGATGFEFVPVGRGIVA